MRAQALCVGIPEWGIHTLVTDCSLGAPRVGWGVP